MKGSHLILAPIVLVALLATGCAASGSAIVTGSKRSPLSLEQVTVYLEPPAKFEVIGLVSASSHSGWSDQDKVDHAVRELKHQAARLGANGLILSATVETSTSVVSDIPVRQKTVQGKAIYIEESR
jgi:hypothetical protein